MWPPSPNLIDLPKLPHPEPVEGRPPNPLGLSAVSCIDLPAHPAYHHSHERQCIESRCCCGQATIAPLLRLVDSRRLFPAGNIRRWPGSGADNPRSPDARRPQYEHPFHWLYIYPGRWRGHGGRPVSRLVGRPVRVATVGPVRRFGCRCGIGPVLIGSQSLAFSRDILYSLCRNDGGVQHDNPFVYGEPVVRPWKADGHGCADDRVCRRSGFRRAVGGSGARRYRLAKRPGVYRCFPLRSYGCGLAGAAQPGRRTRVSGRTAPRRPRSLRISRCGRPYAPAPSGPWSWAGWY